MCVRRVWECRCKTLTTDEWQNVCRCFRYHTYNFSKLWTFFRNGRKIRKQKHLPWARPSLGQGEANMMTSVRPIVLSPSAANSSRPPFHCEALGWGLPMAWSRHRKEVPPFCCSPGLARDDPSWANQNPSPGLFMWNFQEVPSPLKSSGGKPVVLELLSVTHHVRRKCEPRTGHSWAAWKREGPTYQVLGSKSWGPWNRHSSWNSDLTVSYVNN